MLIENPLYLSAAQVVGSLILGAASSVKGPDLTALNMSNFGVAFLIWNLRFCAGTEKILENSRKLIGSEEKPSSLNFHKLSFAAQALGSAANVWIFALEGKASVIDNALAIYSAAICGLSVYNVVYTANER